MAQAGTDIIVVLAPGEALVSPMDMVLLGGAASLGTTGTTASTITVDHNGAATLLTFSLTAAGSSTEENVDVNLVAGDSVTVAATYGTGAAGASVSLWLQRSL